MNVTRHKLADLEHDPHWPVKERGDEKELRKLAADMIQRGQLQPLIAVRDGDKLIVIDGNRRLAAARLENA